MRLLSCPISVGLLFSALAATALLFVADRSVAGSKIDNFGRADANHDGKLSREELGDYLVYEVFSICDSNGDGKISLKEWLRVKQDGAAAFKERDANDDGYVTLTEAITYGRRGGAGLSLLKKADKNHDGKVDRAELQVYFGSR